MEITPIAHIRTDFSDKFGIPRQAGLVKELTAEIIFEPAYRAEEAFLGITEYSHLWLLWDFSAAHRDGFSPTVYPPRLGGKVKKGVFATRSPFRPNSIGLSCVELTGLRFDPALGPVLTVAGADLLDGTPIYDVKPYLPYTDSRPEALGSFAEEHKNDGVPVTFPKELLELLPEEKRSAALAVLAQDPRAAYQKHPGFVYGMAFGGFDIRFTAGEEGIVVRDVVKRDNRFTKVKEQS